MARYSIWNAFYVSQTTQQTCWRACYEIMLRYKAMDPKKVYGLPNYNNMCARGILDSEFAACASVLKLGGIRFHWFKDITNVEHALRCWGPVWMSGFFGYEGSKHVVVLKGVDTGSNEVEINDPWRGYTANKTDSRWVPFSWFASKINPVSWSCQLWY